MTEIPGEASRTDRRPINPRAARASGQRARAVRRRGGEAEPHFFGDVAPKGCRKGTRARAAHRACGREALVQPRALGCAGAET